MTQTVAITGATGLVGSALVHALHARGDRIVAFSRTAQPPAHFPGAVRMARWQPAHTAGLVRDLEGCDVIVNLVGASIAGKRWTEPYKRILADSRVLATQQLLAAVRQLPKRPHTLISSSGSGYYGIDTHPKSEQSPAGTDFLAQLCVDWEAAAAPAQDDLHMRLAVVRTGVVLDRRAGALPLMALPFQLFVGGPVSPGSQMLSWIHIDDMVRIILWLIDNPQASGAYNACAPQPVSNAAFSQALGHALHRPSWLPVPQFALRTLFGEMAEALLIGGQAVVPQRLQSQGFTFTYATAEHALQQIWKG